MTRFAAIMLVCAAPLTALAHNAVLSTDTPLAVWKFPAANEPGVPKTSAKFLGAGPRPPTYPAFADTNTAMAFNAAHPSITIREADLPNANLRFGLNDSITIEAWVKLAELKD